MSQPKQYADGEQDPLAHPIESIEDLVEYFISAQKPRAQFLVGVEHEKFAYLIDNGKPLPFSGDRGIEALLRKFGAFAATQGENWEPVHESGHIIAMMHGAASITLEPGGQVELSGAPFKTVHDVHIEMVQYEEKMAAVAEQMGIGFLSLGYHPFAKRSDIEWVPKPRYGIMREYMPRVGLRGIDMMLRTCTVQVNLDYESETDMALSCKTALAVSPIVTALFANSPFAEGVPTGVLSERTLVWHATDPNRSGFPPVVFEPDFGYEKWIQFVLDVPMYFIRREGRYIDLAGASFRDFMKHGLQGHQAMVRDFVDHLTTIFTEVRIKPQIELRSADCGPPPFLRALPAFWKGILYDVVSRKKAFDLMNEPSADELHKLQLDAAQRGMNAVFRGMRIGHLAERLLEISAEGLAQVHMARPKEQDERHFLKPLIKVVEQNETLAEHMLRRYHSDWQGDITRML